MTPFLVPFQGFGVRILICARSLLLGLTECLIFPQRSEMFLVDVQMLQELHPLDISGPVVPTIEVLVMANERPFEPPSRALLLVESIGYMMNKLIFTSCGLHHTQILVQSVLDTGRVEIAGHQAIVWCKVLGGFISAVAQHESVVCRTANNVAVIKCYLKKTLIMSCYT